MKFISTKAYNYVAPALLLAFVTVGCVSSSSYQKLEEQYKESQNRAQELESANKELNDRIAELTASLEAKDAEIAELQAREPASSGQSEQLTALLAEKAALERELAALKSGQRGAEVSFNGLSSALKKELEEGNVTISNVEGVIRLTIEDGVFFNSGSATINSRGYDLLKRIANAMKDVPDYGLAIEGHTDNVPIGAKLRRRYATNWDLGAARAINVVRFLSEQAGMDPKRLEAQTPGQYQPENSNSTATGRAANRRIQIRVVQLKAAPESAAEPAESAPMDTEAADESATPMEEASEPNETMEPIDEVQTEEDEVPADGESEESTDETDAGQPEENVQ
jgi:chemotaxis protein MotB